MKVRIGGQAVMEGVMMKNEDRYAVSVRKPDGEIETKTERYTSISDRYPVLKLPVLRGVVNFAESMVIGMKTLTYSADFIEDVEEEPSRLEPLPISQRNGKGSSWAESWCCHCHCHRTVHGAALFPLQHI